MRKRAAVIGARQTPRIFLLTVTVTVRTGREREERRTGVFRVDEKEGGGDAGATGAGDEVANRRGEAAALRESEALVEGNRGAGLSSRTSEKERRRDAVLDGGCDMALLHRFRDCVEAGGAVERARHGVRARSSSSSSLSHRGGARRRGREGADDGGPTGAGSWTLPPRSPTTMMSA